MATAPGYLLDTNILLNLLRGNPHGKWIATNYQLDKSLNHCLICVVTVGEMLSLARQFQWGQKKQQQLKDALDELVWIDINHPDILNAYAEIDHACLQRGKLPGKNDVWIAATAKVTGVTLLTSDRHFDSLHPQFLTRLWVDPTSVVTP